MFVWILLLICLDRQTDAQQPQQHCCAEASVSHSDKISCPAIMKSSDSEQRLHLYLNNTLHCTLDIIEGVYSFQVPSSQSGVLCCQTEHIYPPPYKTQCNTTQLREEQNLPAANQSVVPTEQKVFPANQTATRQCLSMSQLDMAVWAVSGFLLVYSLSITCITVYIWKKLGRMKEECSSEYYNTKPGEFKRSSRV